MDFLSQISSLLKTFSSLGFSTWSALGAGFIFAILLLAALLLFLKKKLKPFKLPLKPAICGCASDDLPDEVPALSWLGRLALTVDYIRTNREWRYKNPWVLMLGEQGAGKSSLLSSIPAEYQQPLHGRNRVLAIEGTRWHDFNRGFLIDPDGALPFNAAEVSDEDIAARKKNIAKWNGVLKQLNDLRPERPLDAIVIVLSAIELQKRSRDERQLLANNIRQQLNTITTNMEFSLPVYVVLSKLDSVVGFSEFWRVQEKERCEEMVGWSAPSQSLDGPVEAWVAEAFAHTAQQLKALQLEAAGKQGNWAENDVDKSFLFPFYFKKLEEPLQETLSIIFQASPWQATFFCRGIYFSGVIAKLGSTPTEQIFVRDDVSFVQDIFLKKILEEPGLAKPTRVGVWSRNLLIRRLQVALVASFFLLMVTLGIVCFKIDKQIDKVVNSLTRIQQIQASLHNDNSCTLKAPVFSLLDEVITIDADARSWFIPVSRIDNRLSSQTAERIVQDAFKKVVLPALACHLKQRAAELQLQATTAPVDMSYTESRAELTSYISKVIELEKNTLAFKRLLGAPPFSQERERLNAFFVLVEYVYGTSLPDQVKLYPGILELSLQNLNESIYNPLNLSLPVNFKLNVSNHIRTSSALVTEHLSAELDRGSQLLLVLQQKQQPLLRNIQGFTAWLEWIQSDWLGSTSTQNPYVYWQADLAKQIAPLIQIYSYPPTNLTAASTQIDANQRYVTDMKRLGSLQLPPYGNLFNASAQKLELNPALNNELLGLQAVSQLPYMAIAPLSNFSCQGKVASWRSEYLAQIDTFYKEYQNLLANPLLKSSGEKPLFLLLASSQLELVINHNLQQAQAKALSDAALTNSDTGSLGSLVEQQQSRDSSSFSALVPPLLSVKNLLVALSFNASANQLDKCVSQFAKNNLAQIQLLTEQSMLYQVTVLPSASSENVNAVANFFDLGSVPVVKDFLARQLARVQVLSDYSAPFLSYLKQSAYATNASADNGDSAAYWNNTAAELQRYNQAKDPNAQAVLLNNLFYKQFPGMNTSNCKDIWSAYQSPEFGNDVFSNYRHDLEKAVVGLCSNKRSTQATALYQQLAARFNRELAGHFPFGPLSSDDANFATAKSFFADYESGRDALVQSMGESATWAAKRQFISQLDGVATFFHNSFAQPTMGSAELNAVVTFRALAGQGSEQVASWKLSTTASSLVYPNQGNSFVWSFGQPISLDLTWASNSLWRPAFGNSYQVSGTTASITSTGAWSLLRLVAAHRPSETSGVEELGANSILLEFNVPLVGRDAPNSTTTVSALTANALLYMSLQLSSVDPVTKASVGLILPNQFPVTAPQ